jgi:hypothetical protein
MDTSINIETFYLDDEIIQSHSEKEGGHASND